MSSPDSMLPCQTRKKLEVEESLSKTGKRNLDFNEPVETERMSSDTKPINHELKSDFLQKAEDTFRSILKKLTKEHEIVDFISFVEETLLSEYGFSIFRCGPTPNKPKEKVEDTHRTPKYKAEEIGTPTKAFRKTKKQSKKSDMSLVTSSDSILLHCRMKDIVNYDSFNLLSAREKNSLLEYLPPVDRKNIKSIEDLFRSDAFSSNLTLFQNLLEAGEFEESNEYIEYLKGKQKRDILDPWKEKHYEEFWGQKEIRQTKYVDNTESSFSFTELDANICNSKSDENDEQISDEEADVGVRKRKKDKEDEEPYLPPSLARRKKIKKNEKKDSQPVKNLEHAPKKIKKLHGNKDTEGDLIPNGNCNSFRHVAYEILKREGKPLSASAIVRMAMEEGLISTTGKTPQNTLASVIYCEIKKDPQCVFTKVAPMTFGLREFREQNGK